MGLKDLFKREKIEEIVFPLSIKTTAEGKIVKMEDIPDPVFAQGMVGPCIGIEPIKGTIVAPYNGKIIQLSDTLHAFGIAGPAGAMILVHIGIDTVGMNGEGFTAKVSVGDTVKAGQPIVEVDLEKVKEAGHPSVVITIFTNPNDYKGVIFTDTKEITFDDELIRVEN